MTTMNGFRLQEEDNSIIITCSGYTDKNGLFSFIKSKVGNIKFDISHYLELPVTKSNYQITINNYDGIVLIIVENNKDRDYYLFDQDVRILEVREHNTKVSYSDQYSNINNENIDDDNNSSKLVGFINYLSTLKDVIAFNFDSLIICNNLGIFDDFHSTIITQDNDIMLVQPIFYKCDIRKMKLNIVLKKGLKVVGSLECYLSDEGKSNFNYQGNIQFNVRKPYRSMGYERKSLGILKNYIHESLEPVNKDLFIAATEDDDLLISSIAISNGGKLEYDGEVPKSDPLNFVGKVRSVKIYKIKG